MDGVQDGETAAGRAMSRWRASSVCAPGPPTSGPVLSQSEKARAFLEREYPYPACSISTGERGRFADHEPKLDLRQLSYGRLYVPVENAIFERTTVHRSALLSNCPIFRT